jgi:sulfite exporter TauE/SafE
MTPGAALVTGLLAGLFGSTHCVAMCGGIMGRCRADAIAWPRVFTPAG